MWNPPEPEHGALRDVAAALAPPAAPPRRVLLVDDNFDAADALAELLRIDGHEVHVAHDSLRALALAFARCGTGQGLSDANARAARRLRQAAAAAPTSKAAAVRKAERTAIFRARSAACFAVSFA